MNSEPHVRVTQLLDELQAAARAKDHAATLDLFTHDAALLGTAAANLDRQAVAAYVALEYGQEGYVHWEWETVSVVDMRPGAVTFIALGTAGLDVGGDYPTFPIRLTGLAVDDDDRWRLRLFHGSVATGSP